MKPQEKADELINKFIPHIAGADRYNSTLGLYDKYIAKQCALIAVDEILNLMIKEFKWDVKHNGNIEYWQEVKQAIQEL